MDNNTVCFIDRLFRSPRCDTMKQFHIHVLKGQRIKLFIRKCLFCKPNPAPNLRKRRFEICMKKYDFALKILIWNNAILKEIHI